MIVLTHSNNPTQLLKANTGGLMKLSRWAFACLLIHGSHALAADMKFRGYASLQATKPWAQMNRYITTAMKLIFVMTH